ncbi:hypothetical protein M9H77_04928 [Catharanthus roseus]|uniref:Uncharacterized protein n=1 Tax=Catharanthus roseus TaxID=4058 RepID=A0ACC0CFM7_CATRO|nr:hypothetical protein M9H77_04928 [Catharanthus roseus]
MRWKFKDWKVAHNFNLLEVDAYSYSFEFSVDFNCVLNGGDRNGNAHVSSYEVLDFLYCCIDLGLVDLNSISYHYTWTNNTVWSKIDRAMCMQSQFTSGLQASARKLKLLKTPLKAVNKNHFGHISTKADIAREDLKVAQYSLHDILQNTTLREAVTDLQEKTT